MKTYFSQVSVLVRKKKTKIMMMIGVRLLVHNKPRNKRRKVRTKFMTMMWLQCVHQQSGLWRYQMAYCGRVCASLYTCT